MGFKRILGILLIIAGIVAICVSSYIKNEVEVGKGKLARGEQQVAQGKALFNLTPETAPVGDALTAGAERQIAQGHRDVAKYEKMAQQLLYAGIAAIVIGVILVILPRRKKTNPS